MKHLNKKRVTRMIVLASVLALLLGVIGGTLAYLAARSGPVENTFTFGSVPVEIPEKFDGTTKTDVKVHNQGTADAFVRAKIVVTWKNATGEISGVQVRPGDYTLEMNSNDWFEKDGFWYCKNRVAAGQDSAVLLRKATKTGTAPEGFDLSVEILAQSIQADGMKNNLPMVENFWPVNAQPDNQNPQTITAK